MARNLTRSSSGTVWSWASSSTRRLNSSQDSSRLTSGAWSVVIESAAEGFSPEEAVTDPARADDQREVAAEHQPSSTMTAPARMVSARSALSPRKRRRSRSGSASSRSRRAVTSAERRRTPWRCAGDRPDARRGACGRACGPCRRGRAAHRRGGPRAGPSSRWSRISARSGADLARGRRIPCRNRPRHAHRADGDARRPRRCGPRGRRELEAAAAEVADDALLMGRCRIAASAPRRASSRSLSRRTSAPSRCFRTCSRQSRFGASLTAAVATAMSRSGAPLMPRRPRNPLTEDSVRATASGGSSPARPSREAGLDSLLLQHAVPDAGIDPGQHEARRIGPEIQEREELGHVPSVSKGVMRVKSHVRYDVIHRHPPT